jgi:hypothetical protein
MFREAGAGQQLDNDTGTFRNDVMEIIRTDLYREKGLHCSTMIRV